MNKHLVRGVLVTTLLIPASYIYAKSADTQTQLPETLKNLPTEVAQASIALNDKSEDQYQHLALIDIQKAVVIAQNAAAGAVTEAGLNDENGYLIWDISEVTDQGDAIEIKVDAGNGQILAANFDSKGDKKADDDQDEHFWKFWEDDDDSNRLSTSHDIRD